MRKHSKRKITGKKRHLEGTNITHIRNIDRASEKSHLNSDSAGNEEKLTTRYPNSKNRTIHNMNKHYMNILIISKFITLIRLF